LALFETGIDLMTNPNSMTTDLPLYSSNGVPVAQGLYDPANEHDSCGVGFVAHIKGERSRQIIDDADRILRHMSHRGACGCEANTGDGAGMLTGIPYQFLCKVVDHDLGKKLPPEGKFGVGLVFLPTEPGQRKLFKDTLNKVRS
jgi:glutamate synthase (NADPH) large chain